MSENNLYYLHDLSDYKVASDYPDIRGWDMKDAGGRVIGRVDGLLVNKTAERVVYLDVEVNASTIEESQKNSHSANNDIHEFTSKDGDDHLIIPIGLVEIFEDEKHVQSKNIDYDTFKGTKRYSKVGTIDREYELTVYRQYVPLNTKNEGIIVSDDLYNREEFQSNKKSRE